MGVVPRLKESCFCCTLKTGSLVTACFLLVGSGVQLGYYCFLVDHMNPPKMCNYSEIVRVKVDRPAPPANVGGYDYDYYGEDDDADKHYPFHGYPPRQKNARPQGRDAANTADGEKKNSTYTTNTTVGEQADSIFAAYGTVGEPTNWSNEANTTVSEPINSSNAANTMVGEPRNSSKAVRKDSTVSNRRSPWSRPRYRFPPKRFGWPFSIYDGGWDYKQSWYQRPCPREYKPFDAYTGLLDFDVRAPYDKSILYVNIGMWATLMVATILLMVAVYKDSACMVGAWLATEALLMIVAAAAAVAAAVSMFGVVPIKIGIVTLLNMAIQLGINCYMLMVVYNYRRQLTGKLKDEQGTVGADNLAVELSTTKQASDRVM